MWGVCGVQGVLAAFWVYGLLKLIEAGLLVIDIEGEDPALPVEKIYNSYNNYLFILPRTMGLESETTLGA